MQCISGTIEGNDARAVRWGCGCGCGCGWRGVGGGGGYQLEDTYPLWSHYYSDGTKLQLDDILSQVIAKLSHSLGSLSSALSSADWLLRNTNRASTVSAITILSETFGIEGFTISITGTWSWILKQCREFNKGSAMAFLVNELVTPDVGNRRQGKILHDTVNYKCYSVTSKNSSDFQRFIANIYKMKKQKDRHSTLPMLASMATRLWRFVQMTQIFL